MSTHLLAPLMAKLATTAEAIEGLRDLFAAEEPLDDIAARVTETAVAAIPHADAVSITVLSWPQARTAACTHDLASELDHQQYASGRGPCLEAASQRAPARAEIGEEHSRWPEFVEAAQRLGIRASLSVPLLIVGSAEEQELVGSLNIYSRTASAFEPYDAELIRLYTFAAGQAISNAKRWQHSRDTVTQLETALLSRSDIDMAKGALIALHGCEPSEAFAKLVAESQRRNIKVHKVALELLDSMKASEGLAQKNLGSRRAGI
ncbi:GAF and ANTAR domain-containing protein [Mycobacterium deserti]|uniref:GAF and ANTAR domain-containing protein n=1 Tax=Mycobacterium deserti TaxID=2978347 RepID=A0ABT2M5D0_9MYCO|nr:GAF and ANTAR domain-containing protein [Mycobacterium deserti]MCT7657472.1 GAF and ANTAR domain-containing protein [Mycobacterium deserti]